MVYKVTGCIDCPLFDYTGSEYGTYCHHPQRPFHWGSGGKFSGLNEIYNGLLIGEKERDRVNAEIEQKQKDWDNYKFEWVDELEIEETGQHDPITPDWCPLNKESITISKQ